MVLGHQTPGTEHALAVFSESHHDANWRSTYIFEVLEINGGKMCSANMPIFILKNIFPLFENFLNDVNSLCIHIYTLLKFKVSVEKIMQK
jgi:hypothetical protein